MILNLGETFSKDHLLKKDNLLLSSTIQRIWHLLHLRPDNSETARRDMKRESLNTPIQSPHFQSRSGIWDHTGGTNSHVGMMDFPRVPITEWNPGKFPDFSEFQSWKLNFRTEVCKRTAESQVTMLWIKEVEITKSIDELVTSRSITGQHNFLATRSQSSEKE